MRSSNPSSPDLPRPVPTELGHRQRRAVPPRPHLPERQPEHPERPADLRGVERRRLLAGPEPGGVRLHRGWHAGNLEADRPGHCQRRSRQRGIPGRIFDPEHRGRGPEAPRRSLIVGGSGRGQCRLEDRLPRGSADRPTRQRESGRRHRPLQRHRPRQRTAGGID